mgnify:CR=1 FL=1
MTSICYPSIHTADNRASVTWQCTPGPRKSPKENRKKGVGDTFLLVLNMHIMYDMMLVIYYERIVDWSISKPS